MFIAPTWDAAALQRWVRIPPHGCRGPAALANDAGVTEDEPHPAAEVVPSPAGPSHVHPHRPCPKRALSIGRQRSFTDNKGRCAFPPSCRIAPYGAARGSFPSSRWTPRRRLGDLGASWDSTVDLRDLTNRLVGGLQRWCRAVDAARVGLVARSSQPYRLRPPRLRSLDHFQEHHGRGRRVQVQVVVRHDLASRATQSDGFCGDFGAAMVSLLLPFITQ
jgi:hypothetical protein